MISIENVTSDASLERNEYHKLALHQLDELDDAEALYQIADRIMNGIGTKKDEEQGLGIMSEAARRGHAVALGLCFLHGRGVDRNKARAFQLFRASADRGHASGSHELAFDLQTPLTIIHSSILVGRMLSQRQWACREQTRSNSLVSCCSVSGLSASSILVGKMLSRWKRC
jgi:TPR repeat protein